MKCFQSPASLVEPDELREGVRRLRPGTGRPYATAREMVDHVRDRGLYRGFEETPLAVLVYTEDWPKIFMSKLGRPHQTFYEHSLFEVGGDRAMLQRATPGGQMAAHFVEKLAALGARRVVALGHAGGIADAAEIGDLVLFDRALCGDGTSQHYTDAPSIEPSASLFSALRSRLEIYDNVGGFSRGYFVGATLSTGSFFRESEQRIDLCRSAGVVAVEAEAAAVFAAGRRLGIEVAALAVISNVVRRGSWQQDYFGHRVLAAKLAMVDVALAALRAT